MTFGFTGADPVRKAEQGEASARPEGAIETTGFVEERN